MEDLGDFDLADNIFLRVVELEEKEGFSSLNPYQQTVLFVWHSMGLIGNGGIARFFLWDDASESVAIAYENIGCNDIADIIRSAFKIFPETIVENSELRCRYLEENHDKLSDKINSWNDSLWKNEELTVEKTANFIRKNLINFELNDG